MSFCYKWLDSAGRGKQIATLLRTKMCSRQTTMDVGRRPSASVDCDPRGALSDFTEHVFQSAPYWTVKGLGEAGQPPMEGPHPGESVSTTRPSPQWSASGYDSSAVWKAEGSHDWVTAAEDVGAKESLETCRGENKLQLNLCHKEEVAASEAAHARAASAVTKIATNSRAIQDGSGRGNAPLLSPTWNQWGNLD